jgi:hypothetical protein
MSRVARVSALALALVSSACSDGPTAPGIQPEIVNLTDSFEYQVSSVQDYSGVVDYSWANTGTQANVDQSTTVTSGALALEIRDAGGTLVYEGSLADNGSFQTLVGAAGTWSVRLRYDGMSGTVNFRAQKR